MNHKMHVWPGRGWPLFLAVMLLGGLAACGGYTDDPHGFRQEPFVVAIEGTPQDTQARAGAEASPQPSPQAEDQEGERIALVAEEIAFDREQITVPAGAPIIIEFTNEDNILHNFSLYRGEVAGEALFTGEVIRGPDRTTRYEFDAPGEAGSYFFRCDRHPTIMTGELVVETAD